jgi:hypothetical protein
MSTSNGHAYPTPRIDHLPAHRRDHTGGAEHKHRLIANRKRCLATASVIFIEAELASV